MRVFALISIGLSLLLAACNLNTSAEGVTPTLLTNVPTAVSALATATPQTAPTNSTAIPLPSATPITTGSTTSSGGASNCTVRADWNVTYTVVSGDTLFKIAQQANSSIPELATGNCLASPDSIYAGQVLRLPRAFGQPNNSNNYTGTIFISSFIAADAGNFTLLRGDTITLRWDGAPTGISQARFYVGNTGNVIGTDTNGADGWSMSWTVPGGVNGPLGALGTVPNVNTIIPSYEQGVYSAPPPGQGCEVAASSPSGVMAYMQPDASSGTFGLIKQGQYVEVLGRSLNGWYGFDPGVAQAGVSGPARLRWLPPDGALTMRGPFCGGDSAPVVQTYTNSALGIAFDYPSSWSVVESGDFIDVYMPDGRVALEVKYGPAGQATPIATAVNDFKNSGAGIGNRALVDERPLSISGGFSGTRLEMGPDPVDNEPSENSVVVFSIVNNRNIYFTGFYISAFDTVMNTVRGA